MVPRIEQHREKEADMQRVEIVHTPELHGKGKDSPRCTCKGLTGVVQTAFPDGIAIVKLDKGGRVGIPYNCLREIR